MVYIQSISHTATTFSKIHALRKVLPVPSNLMNVDFSSKAQEKAEKGQPPWEGWSQ